MAPSMEDKVKTLRTKREVFKLELQAFVKVLETYEPDAHSNELKLRLAELESEYATFAKVQSELDTVDENGTYTRERLQIKHDYTQCRARAQDLLQPTRTTAAPEAIAHASKSGTEHTSRFAEGARTEYINLPSLPQFKGCYEDWPGFADQFRATIHENSKLSDCKNLTYLARVCTGNPRRVSNPSRTSLQTIRVRESC